MRKSIQSVFVGVLLALAGCISPYPYEAFTPRVSPALGEMRPAHAAVQLYYATSRRRTESRNPELMFGIERSPRTALGRAEVSIPAAHGRGRLEERHAIAPRNPDRFVLLTRLDGPTDTSSAFWADLRQSLNQSARREVFVFVHGFYVTFDDAARRTAQIAHDIEFDGPAIVYSWPSQGWLLGYLADSTNVEWAEPHLSQFLSQLASQSRADHVHILAHSMGARLLSRAVRELVRDGGAADGPVFDQIVLAAADVDAEIFERDYAPPLSKAARRVTLYVSKNDWALGGSEKIHGYVRLGREFPDEASRTYADIFDVVDVTDVDRGIVGHFYYGASSDVLNDLRGIFAGKPPHDRGLSPDNGHFHLGESNE
ncbi:MAG: alpha/beta hydrolase [Phycisphaerae bacterium]